MPKASVSSLVGELWQNSTLKNFFSELKRRNVYKVAVAYAVVGWLVIQVSATVLPTFHAPEWVVQTLVVLVAVGFPIALVIAWAFELTPEGIKRTEDVDLAASARQPRKHAWIVVVIVGAALSVGLFFIGRYTARNSASASELSAKSIAVLPFVNMSADKNDEYLSDGVSEELIAALSKINGLQVKARTSSFAFKGKNEDIQKIGDLLHASHLLEGSVAKAGNKLRITAQLIQASDGNHEWSDTYDRDMQDIFAVRSEVAQKVAETLKVRLLGEEKRKIDKKPTENLEAYDAYLKGRYFFNRPSDQNLSKAISQFEDAVRLDPNFAAAYSGLSDAYLWAAFNEGIITAAEGKRKARSTAEKSLQLNEASAEAHTSLANYLSWYEHDWAASEREFRRAIALNPNYAFAHDQFALTLALQGRLAESETEGRRAAQLDPLNPAIAIDNTLGLTAQGEFQQAKEEAKRGAELDPEFFFPQLQFGWIDIQAGNAKAAIPALQKAVAMESPPFVIAWLGYAYGAAGDRNAALATIEQLKKKSVNGYVPQFNLAMIHLGLGDRDRALDLLEQASAADSQWMMYLKIDRIFDSLRADPRFVALMKKCHFEK
jgi:serine/threonine-protein kinase